MESLFKIINALIKNYKKAKNSNGLAELSKRIDVLYATEKLTEDEYKKLTEAIPKSE